VNSEYKKGLRTQPCGAPALIDTEEEWWGHLNRQKIPHPKADVVVEA